jgi:hypothetical protein
MADKKERSSSFFMAGSSCFGEDVPALRPAYAMICQNLTRIKISGAKLHAYSGIAEAFVTAEIDLYCD